MGVFWCENVKDGDELENLGIDRRELLNSFLNN